MTNQTAIHALPAAINALSNSLLSAVTGGASSIAVTNAPLPTLNDEQQMQVSQLAGRQPSGSQLGSLSCATELDCINSAHKNQNRMRETVCNVLMMIW